jgi:hypothetical protein
VLISVGLPSPPFSNKFLILRTLAALSSTNAHLPLAPPHYGDHDPSYNDNRQLANGYEDVDEEERIGLGADNAEEEEGDDASVDSVVPREEYRR